MKNDLPLRAWEAWHECLTAYTYLETQDSPGEDRYWRIFWIGILTLLRSVRDVLDRVDRRQSELHDAVISDFDRHITDNRKLHPIYWEFICNERNNIVHEFSFEAKAYPVTRRPFLVDTTLTYDKLVAKYGEYRIIIWGEELEDGLRLADIGLTWGYKSPDNRTGNSCRGKAAVLRTKPASA